MEESENGNGQENQDNDPIVRGEPFQAASDQPAVQQLEPDHEEQAAHQRNGEPFQHRFAPEQDRAHRKSGGHSRQPAVGSEHADGQGKGDRMVARRTATAKSGNHIGQPGHSEFPVQIEIDTAPYMEALEAHGQRNQ